jgi:hypothetical protein
MANGRHLCILLERATQHTQEEQAEKERAYATCAGDAKVDDEGLAAIVHENIMRSEVSASQRVR